MVVSKALEAQPSRSGFADLALLALCILVVLNFGIMGWGGAFWGNLRPLSISLGVILPSAAMIAIYALMPGKAHLPQPRAARLILAISIIALCLFVALVTFRGFQNSPDEYAYLFEARTFLLGKLWNAPPPLGQAFANDYSWVAQGKWVGQYPPGWPAFLALFEAVHAFRMANAVLVALTAIGVGLLVRTRASRDVAWSAALLFGLSPYTLFQGGSTFSHPMAAALIVAVMLAVHQAMKADARRSVARWLLVGGLVGILGVTRSITALIAAVAVFAIVAPKPGRLTRLWWVGVGGVPFVLLLLWYQGQITGDPLKPVYWISGRNVDHLYFDYASIKSGLRLTLAGLVELSLWISPVFLAMWGVAMLVLLRARRLSPMDFIFPAGMFIFVFYPLHPGMRYGPRYYFDVWPMAVVTIGMAIAVLQQKRAAIFSRAIVASIVYGLATFVALNFEYRRPMQDRMDVYHVAEAAGLRDAIICLDTPSGWMFPLAEKEFARNGFDANGPVLYIRCSLVTQPEIQRAFPDRDIWAYAIAKGDLHGRLRLVASRAP